MGSAVQSIVLFVAAVLLGVGIIVVMSIRAQRRAEEKAGSTRRADFLRSIPEAPSPGVVKTLHVAVFLSLFWSLGAGVYAVFAALFSARTVPGISGPASALSFAAVPLLVFGIAVFHTVVGIAFFRNKRWVPRFLAASLPMVLLGSYLIAPTKPTTVVLGIVMVAAIFISRVLQSCRSLWHHCGWRAEDADRLAEPVSEA